MALCNPQRSKKRRTRNATACMRCRELKKKCDNKLPSCTRCIEFGANCLYLTYEEYQQTLAEAVVELSQELDEIQADVRNLTFRNPQKNQTHESQPIQWQLDNDGNESAETLEFYSFLWKMRQDCEQNESRTVNDEQERDEEPNGGLFEWKATMDEGRLRIDTNICSFRDIYRVLKQSQQVATDSGLCSQVSYPSQQGSLCSYE
ncbi:hypothetical protein CLU79DRAFT_564687 [Phycomyces nitens]|nr:hypothetical protein CLU79DRAFT_564687 [Phycomyces nitens]